MQIFYGQFNLKEQKICGSRRLVRADQGTSEFAGLLQLVKIC